MLARDIMSSPVVTVLPETSVKDAAKLLTERRFTALPVVDADGELLGMVTETDLVRDRVPMDTRYRPGGSGAPVPAMTVGAVMSAPAVSLSSRADVAKLVSAMLDEGFRAIPIVDYGRLAGIVTRADVVRVLSRDDEVVARDVRRRLARYGGARRWHVTVRDGIARIVDEYDDPADRHVATFLAESVPGVISAQALSWCSGTVSVPTQAVRIEPENRW